MLVPAQIVLPNVCETEGDQNEERETNMGQLAE